MTMVATRTPYRVSFFGGGSDYPGWYLENGGAVLSTTIDKYCFIYCRAFPPFFNVKYRVVWSHIENVNSIAEILHPAVREVLRYLDFKDDLGLEILHQGDLPARSGMGSSSSFSVGLFNALLALKNRPAGPAELARQATDLEQNWIKDNVGSQDQVAAAHGGLNIIRFGPGPEIRVEPLAIDPVVKRRLADHLLLIYTGSSRLSSQIAGSVVAGLQDKAALIRQMQSMVEVAASLLRRGDLMAFGELLHETWMLKRGLSESVSSSAIDELYQFGRSKGAVGGKLLGAGHSGFMLFFVPPELQPGFIEAFRNYISVPFGFDDAGSQIIYQAR